MISSVGRLEDTLARIRALRDERRRLRSRLRQSREELDGDNGY